VAKILVINPGSTSTKVAVFAGGRELFRKTVEHTSHDLEPFPRVFDQYQYRLDLILAALEEADVALSSVDAVVGRGGLLKPLPGGAYLVNEQMVADLKLAARGEHASNLGAVLAFNLASEFKVAAFIVDPVSVDELEPVARISGFAGIERISLSHALNMRAVAHQVAQQLGKGYQDVNLITAHLGSGISVVAHRRGRMVDVSNGKDEGAFSPDRSGGVPSTPLMKLCFSGEYTEAEMTARLMGSGGVYAYLGTKDIREIEKLAAGGHEQAELLLTAMSYQVAKEIGAMAAVLAGAVDRIILTGGIAYSTRIVEDISCRVRFIAPLVIAAGEQEMEALAQGALRVLSGEEQAKVYS